MRYRKGMSATNNVNTTADTPISIAAFVRSMPLDMPAAEVIAKGQALGLPVKTSNVHTVRYYDRTNSLRAKAKRPATSVATTPAAARSSNGTSTTPPPVAPNARTAVTPTVVLVPAPASAASPAGDIANVHAELARQLRMIALRIGVDHAQRELVELARVVGASA